MKLGFIGTGKIASSVVTGICKSKIVFTKILLSPRNRNVAKKLKKKLDQQIRKLGKKSHDLLESVEFILNRKF